MIKPASSLPFEVFDEKSNKILDSEGHLIIDVFSGRGQKHEYQDAEYIKTACNELQGLISLALDLKEIAFNQLSGDQKKNLLETLKRCGVEV